MKIPLPLSLSLVALLVLPATADGIPGFVPLEAAVREAGITDIVPGEDGLLLTNAEQTVRFHLGSRQIESTGAVVWLHEPPVLPYKATNGWMVASADLDNVLLPMLAPTQGPPATLLVMLDAGHGGEDGGAKSYDGAIQEKDFTLDMVCRIGTKLEEAGQGVAYTREDDTFIDLSGRPALAAARSADIFVSVHANTAANSLAAGAETYVIPCGGLPATGGGTLSMRSRPGNANDYANNLLAFHIHRRLPGRPRGRDRGVRRARFQVLREATCPAVLVECGFLSNTGDVARLSSEWYRDRLATAICDGILDYAARIPPKAESKPSDAATEGEPGASDEPPAPVEPSASESAPPAEKEPEGDGGKKPEGDGGHVAPISEENPVLAEEEPVLPLTEEPVPADPEEPVQPMTEEPESAEETEEPAQPAKEGPEAAEEEDGPGPEDEKGGPGEDSAGGAT